MTILATTVQTPPMHPAEATLDGSYRLLLTIPDVCAALVISRDAVYELLHSGRLPSVTIGRLRRIRVSDLERFVAALPRTPI